MKSSERKQAGRLGFGALRPYFRLLRGQLTELSIVAILMLGSTGVSLAIPIYAGQFVDILGSETENLATRRTLLILVGLLVLQLCGTFLFTVLSARIGLRTITRLRRELFAHMLELPALYFTRQKAGDMSSRLTSDVGSIQYVLTRGVIALARAVLTLIGAVILMFKLNTRLTTVVLLLIPATILLVRLFGSRLQKLSRRMYDELGKISSHVQETVGGIRSVKVYNVQDHEAGRFQTMIEEYRAAGLKRAWLGAALESGIQISLWICLICVVVYGFTLAARGVTSSGELVAFLLLAFRVATPLASLTNLFSSVQGAVAAAGRLDDLFGVEPERQPGTPVPPIRHQPAAVRLDHIGFAYDPLEPDSPAVLDDVSLAIEPGQWVGIIGPSGAGKTTLAGLIMGLFPPTQGRLLLDEKPYTEFDLPELRACMAYVSQDPMLYDMSLEDNIRFGLRSADAEQVREAARRAGVLEFANRLPDGLNTPCGERGGRLSGGQRQRVALARAFLRDPGILVLDEPTSALDAASEDQIVDALRDLMRGRTAIVIAHRLSLVRDLDRIFVIAEGGLVESGSHTELMEKGSFYRSLYDLQHKSG